MPAPSPPKVYAPHRLSAEGAPAETGSATQLTSAGAAGQSTSSQGAQVTASVGGAPASPGAGTPGTPAVATPTTSTPAAGTPSGGLARTGFDVGLVLMFALIAVLLGVLLVRLGTHRDQPSTSL